MRYLERPSAKHRRPMRAVQGASLVLCLALGLAACGTTSLTGRVGTTLQDHTLRVTVDRFDRHPPIPQGDVTGLSRPAPGDRLVAAHVHLCTHIGPAIGSWDFSISLSGGASGKVNYAATNYLQRFSSVSIGCSTGWIVFEIPQTSTPDSVNFKFDDTGAGGGAYPTRGETHARFSWKT
jgi:hypothetical protein